jgi:M6 family metalloprotease-like protein
MKRTASVMILALVMATNSVSTANAVERKKDSWLASCPQVVDLTPDLPTPKTIRLRSPSGQEFKLLSKDSVEFVSEPHSIIGCYVVEEDVIKTDSSPTWQIGALNRDLKGYYFRNAAGVIWRLSLNTESLVLETQPGSPYYRLGAGFQLDRDHFRASDCKVQDYFSRALRLGFPKNPARVPSIGETKNLILVVDFPDALLTESIDSAVENIISPRIVEDFFYKNSNGRFKPKFTTFPKVITLNSLEKSFAENATGGFFRDGVQQDQRLIFEAVKIARTQGNLEGYSSINILIPTAMSMGYYGGAHIDLPINLGNQTIYNTQMLGGTIGTVKSYVPSWKVFAHEYGHLLGMYDYYVPRMVNSGKSPGPFDLMGNTSGTANSFFGFQRWVQGWFDDSEVICDVTINGAIEHTLSPLNQVAGKRLYVHPLDGSTALVVEYRTDSDFDSLRENAGLLVYTIDMKVASGKGSISIQPSEQDLISNPSSDVERYSTAPLSTGQSVQVKDFVIFAEDVSKNQASFRVFTRAEYSFQQEVKSKANAKLKVAQDLQAKAEFEAKLAKEAQTKSEAEAKLAKEAVVKSEAASKAATEASAALSLELEKVRKELSLLSSQIASLNTSLKAAQSENSSLRKRLATFCKVKPKPKGC